jgi:hypothetical protein
VTQTIKIDSVLWQFAKFYRKKFNANNPDEQIGMNIAAVATLRALEANGDAVEEIDAAGNSILRATPKFLRATGLKRGPLITLGPGIN